MRIYWSGFVRIQFWFSPVNMKTVLYNVLHVPQWESRLTHIQWGLDSLMLSLFSPSSPPVPLPIARPKEDRQTDRRPPGGQWVKAIRWEGRVIIGRSIHGGSNSIPLSWQPCDMIAISNSHGNHAIRWCSMGQHPIVRIDDGVTMVTMQKDGVGEDEDGWKWW